MKFKIFQTNSKTALAKDVNKWLLDNTEIEIRFVNQSECPFEGGVNLTYTILYLDPEI